MAEILIKKDYTIYIVDPDQVHSQTVSSLLGRLGYKTELFSSAEELLDELNEHELDGCIVSEMRLPGISGLELLRSLRNQKMNVPVIILTADSDVSGAVAALRDKASDYLVKPFVERDLVSRVRAALG